jgi:hypothetical protein
VEGANEEEVGVGVEVALAEMALEEEKGLDDGEVEEVDVEGKDV